MRPAPSAGTARVHVMSFGPRDFEEATPERLVDARPYRGRRPVTWVNVNGATDPEVLKSLEEDFGIHHLTVEDVRNTRQRPKVEAYPGYVYVVVQMLARSHSGRLDTEQMSLILGPDWLITVQERPGDIFDPVRERIRQGRLRIRAGGADYLLYSLLDAVVDAYFPIVEAIGADAEKLEDQALAGAHAQTRRRIATLRRQLSTLRRAAWPMRDALGTLERGELALVRPETRTFLRDVTDHVSRVIDFVETNRELAANVMELHAASVAQRTNDVVKVLTIVTVIFIPLTFIAGVYGMNFDPDAGPWNMPELRNPLGYPVTLGVMLLVVLGMLVGFRRKGWI